MGDHSQRLFDPAIPDASISKGMGDQFSAGAHCHADAEQYIKGDG